MGKPGLKKLLIALGWLALWQLASLWVNQSVILAGPTEAFQALLALVVTAEFWQTVLFTFLRILGAFSWPSPPDWPPGGWPTGSPWWGTSWPRP